MGLGDAMARVTNDHIVDSAMSMLMETGHISSETCYLVDDTDLFKKLKIPIDGRYINSCLRIFSDEFVGIKRGFDISYPL